MKDEQIIDLYWARNEQAIPASAAKYGGYCSNLAGNILPDRRDVEEVVSDTWLRAWDAMPPQRPSVLRTFLGRITRNLALHRYEAAHAIKRGGGELPLVLEELEQALPGEDTVHMEVTTAALTRAVYGFIQTLPQREASVFLRRYWFADSTKEIACRFGLREDYILVLLSRIRKKLRDYLSKEEWLS